MALLSNGFVILVVNYWFRISEAEEFELLSYDKSPNNIKFLKFW